MEIFRFSLDRRRTVDEVLALYVQYVIAEYGGVAAEKTTTTAHTDRSLRCEILLLIHIKHPKSPYTVPEPY